MGKNWAIMFNFLEASLTPDAKTDCGGIYVADVVADPPATALYVEVRIHRALTIQ